MPQLNMSSVMGKVNKWFDSSGGEAKTANVIKKCRDGGDGKLASSDYIVTLRDMQSLAEELIRMLKDEAALFANKLPQSVLDHFNSLTHTQPKPTGLGGKQYSIDIYFQDDLSRMSLLITSGNRKGQRTGDGIKNIVSLYDTGYQASKRVYGEWSGHEEDGVIASRTELEGKYFIEKAIDLFNRKYSEMYNLEARATASPEFYSSFNY